MSRVVLELIQAAGKDLGINITHIEGDDYMVFDFEGEKETVKGVEWNLNSDFDITPKLDTIQKSLENNIPCVDAIKLSGSLRQMIKKALKYLKKLGKIVIRGNTGFSGQNTFIVSTKKEVRNAIRKLYEKGILILISPFYDALYEYRVMWIDGEIPFIVQKIRNKDGYHNLSKGAEASIVTDPIKFSELEILSKKIAQVFGMNMIAFDIMDTKEGLKLLEISIPNVGKFSKNYSEHHHLVKEYFKKSLQFKYNL